MRRPLIAIVVLACWSSAAYSQSSAQTDEAQPVHPGTVILDRMGIYAGKQMPVQKQTQAKAAGTQATRVNNPATKP